MALLGILTGLFLVEACGQRLSPQPTCNFVENQQLQRVSWTTNLPVNVYLDSSVPQSYVSSIEGAMAIWNNLGQKVANHDFFVLRSGDPGSPTPAQDGYNKIYVMHTWEPNLANEQARTTIYWEGNRIYEADTRIDAVNFSFFTDALNPDPMEVHLESLVLHELGHMLGLAHTTASDSVMQPSLAGGQIRTTLGTTDVKDMQCQY